ncbi:hypothetical protein [Hyphomicrobium sp.]|jgi:hypothetical protein|uniref:hypothetical protein n=1 Tax=Hyphomicrobium sp. TaxID=82 RepID=UPI003568DD99
MVDSAAERVAAHRSTRTLPPIVAPKEGKPALEIGNRRSANRHSVERPRSLNTPITNRHFELIDDITRHFKAKHGRNGWKMNLTIELAIEDLAQKLGLLREPTSN